MWSRVFQGSYEDVSVPRQLVMFVFHPSAAFVCGFCRMTDTSAIELFAIDILFHTCDWIVPHWRSHVLKVKRGPLPSHFLFCSISLCCLFLFPLIPTPFIFSCLFYPVREFGERCEPGQQTHFSCTQTKNACIDFVALVFMNYLWKHSFRISTMLSWQWFPEVEGDQKLLVLHL